MASMNNSSILSSSSSAQSISTPISTQSNLAVASSTPTSVVSTSIAPIIIPTPVKSTSSTPTSTLVSTPPPTPIIPTPTTPISILPTTTAPVPISKVTAPVIFTLPSFFSDSTAFQNTRSINSTSSSSTSTDTATSTSVTAIAIPYTITSQGKVIVVTLTTSEIVTGSESSAPTAKALNGDTSGYATFFNNTGAVAGTFTVVALLIVASLIGLGYVFVRRRKAKRLSLDERAAVGGAGDGGAGINRFANEEEDTDPFHTSQTSHNNDQSLYYQQYFMTSSNTTPAHFSPTAAFNNNDLHRRSFPPPSVSQDQPINSYLHTGYSPNVNRPRSQDIEGIFNDIFNASGTSGMEVVEEPGEQHRSEEGFVGGSVSRHSPERDSVASQYTDYSQSNYHRVPVPKIREEDIVDERLEPIPYNENLVDEQDYSRRILRVVNQEDEV